MPAIISPFKWRAQARHSALAVDERGPHRAWVTVRAVITVVIHINTGKGADWGYSVCGAQLPACYGLAAGRRSREHAPVLQPIDPYTQLVQVRVLVGVTRLVRHTVTADYAAG